MQLTFEIVGFVHLIVKAVMFEHRKNSALGATESRGRDKWHQSMPPSIAHHRLMDVFSAHFWRESNDATPYSSLRDSGFFRLTIRLFRLVNSLLSFGKRPIQIIGHGHVKHDVTQKFKTLIAF